MCIVPFVKYNGISEMSSLVSVVLREQSRVVQPNMAPNLASSKNELIYDMVGSGELSPRVHFGAFLQALGMYVEAG